MQSRHRLGRHWRRLGHWPYRSRDARCRSRLWELPSHDIAGYRHRKRRTGDYAGIAATAFRLESVVPVGRRRQPDLDLIAGFTVIWTRQKATGTGAAKPGGPGGVKLSAAIEVAVIEITSGKTRLESLVQLSAAAGALKPATDAASAMVNPQDPDIFARFVIWSPSHSNRRPQGRIRPQLAVNSRPFRVL